MNVKIAKELLHIEDWLRRADEIAALGEAVYLEDALLQEAGDSIMMKLGEAARRLIALEVRAPDGIDWTLAVANRNFIIHQYDEISRALTWQTIAVDLPQWREYLAVLIAEAQLIVDEYRQGN